VRIGKEEGAKGSWAAGAEGEAFERGYWFEPRSSRGRQLDDDRPEEISAGAVRDQVRRRRRDPKSTASKSGVVDRPGSVPETAKRLKAGTVWINDFHLINRWPRSAATSSRHRP
jgi:hypothetical protein